jgi:hypothetical protein
MLKFENVANVGDVIKAFDFEPINDPNYPDRFLVGRVVDKGEVEFGYSAYTVEVLESPEYPERVGATMYVPFESFMDYDNRVSLVEAA